MTAWIASTASAGGLKSGESETMPPIILARHLNSYIFVFGCASLEIFCELDEPLLTVLSEAGQLFQSYTILSHKEY